MGRIFKTTKRNEATPLAAHIGNRILHLRQKESVTMREVAAGSGLSNAFICQLENGQSSPSADTLWALGKYFGVPVQFFFEGFVPPSS